MGRFPSWMAVMFAMYVIAFKIDETGANHEHATGTADSAAGWHRGSNSTPSGDSRNQDIGNKIHSKVSTPPVNGKELDSSQTRRDSIPQPQSTSPVQASRRALPAAALAVLKNPAVQEAVIGKGIEVMGKMVDKSFENIERAQNKAADFLKKEIKLDIDPGKAWLQDNMFVPSAYHLDASIGGDTKSPEETGDTPFIYPAGMGQVLMNGCWGKDYKSGDPCYNAKANSSICRDMIDGAAFIGVGFDGSGTYSPESRKMSIVQRNCANKATYDNLDVPDTMNVHGIYDTAAFMMTFENRQQYQQYLQHEAGMSGSIFGFSGGVKAAYGGSMQESSQQYMAMMDVDIDRYEIFMDEVKPSDLSLSFLREFMSLPLSFFNPGAQVKYQNFIQRWGTHYIKSAKFGGQLEIIKTMLATQTSSKAQFAAEMEAEYRGLFASAGAKSSTEGGAESRELNKFTSTSVIAQGGSQEIATILSDVYSPNFKQSFKEWLQSIPAYPKAFRFLLGTIADLVNFRANDLFAGETVDWGCEGHGKDLQEEQTEEGTRKFYTVTENGKTEKFYCPFQDRGELDTALSKRRASLKRAIEIYMEEGPISVSDMQIPECKAENPSTGASEDFLAKNRSPAWDEVTNRGKTIKVTFDMENDLAHGLDGVVKIQRNMTREVRFARGRWFTADKDGKFHMFSGYRNGKSGELTKRKISVLGLVLSYNSKYGSLELSGEDYKESKKIYPSLSEEQVGFPLARVSVLDSESPQLKRSASEPAAAVTPCNLKWSNALRLDPTTNGGRCLLFTASSAGDFFVVFATLPSQPSTWYYVHIGVSKVAIYKGANEVTSTSDIGALSIADALLYQSYFVCLYERPESTLIEYGKILSTSDSAHVYLMHLDREDPLNVQFYAFGNLREVVKIWDAHIIQRDRMDAECKGATYKDLRTNLCAQKCHQYCDPFAGCRNPGADPLLPSDCLACRDAKDPKTDFCLEKCPENEEPLEGTKYCLITFDAKMQGTGRSDVRVDNIPQLSHMTLCLWTKFIRSPASSNERKMNTLVDYSAGSSAFVLMFNDLYGQDVYGRFVLRGEATAAGLPEIRFSRDFLNDQEWHHFCITWNGVSGVTLVYVDGERDSQSVRSDSAVNPDALIKDTVPGGGSLKLLSRYAQTIHLTEFNLWNTVLSVQEIDDASKSCVGSQGNVKRWFDFWPSFKDKTLNHETPSKCRSSREPTPTERPEGDLATGNKNHYLKLKEQAVKKYTRKGH